MALRMRCAPRSHFNPRSPHGERPEDVDPARMVTAISIHAPRTGSDFGQTLRAPSPWLFQSTLPARGATSPLLTWLCFPADFNPRSPHGERLLSISLPSASYHFNPRSPHGERLLCAVTSEILCDFNPRSPHGERHGKQGFTFV